MVTLPDAFMDQTRRTMGADRFERFLASFDEETPVSIRLRPTPNPSQREDRVPWCRHAFYLSSRPVFTFDPLLHAGCYYVQEAASMFLDTVLQQHLPERPVMALDMCAAPGGKSTLMRTALPEGSVMFSNEPVRQRASILLENITKWGYDDCFVTNNYPRDYRKAKMMFDVILCDVPCSGEGMFRKDAQTISEWSPQNVERCWRLQREIVSDAWQCLAPGGLLIYSTCTFNTLENEENVRWILDTFDASLLTVDTLSEWNISGSLLPSLDAPVYRFIPGITRSEGLFMCAFRKSGTASTQTLSKSATFARQKCHSCPPKVPLSVLKSATFEKGAPSVDLPYAQAIAFLRGEAFMLPPDTPRGIVTITFMGHALGQMKNLGTRANNLYPKEWRIKSTHVPKDYVPVI